MNKFVQISRCALVGLLALAAANARAQSAKDILTSDGEKSPVTERLGEAATQPDDDALTAVGSHCRCVVGQDPAAIERIEAALRGPIKSTGIDFNETPLEEVVSFLQTEYGIPIQLDHSALEEIGLSADEPVTTALHNISLRSALRLMLKPLQLTYIIQDEVLIITTPEEAESQLVVCVYDIRDLIEGSKDHAGIESLVDMIASCVETNTWATNGGGESEIHFIKPGLLIVSQTQAVHEEIRSVLATIRAVRGEQPEAIEGAATTESDDNAVVTRSYMLQLGSPEQSDNVRVQVRELIAKSLPDEQWDRRVDDQPVLLSVLPDRVVVRHTPEVQEKVEKLLRESGIASPASQATYSEGQGGFGGSGSGGFGGGGGGLGGFGGDGSSAIEPEPTIAQ